MMTASTWRSSWVGLNCTIALSGSLLTGCGRWRVEGIDSGQDDCTHVQRAYAVSASRGEAGGADDHRPFGHRYLGHLAVPDVLDV